MDRVSEPQPTHTDKFYYTSTHVHTHISMWIVIAIFMHFAFPLVTQTLEKCKHTNHIPWQQPFKGKLLPQVHGCRVRNRLYQSPCIIRCTYRRILFIANSRSVSFSRNFWVHTPCTRQYGLEHSGHNQWHMYWHTAFLHTLCTNSWEVDLHASCINKFFVP